MIRSKASRLSCFDICGLAGAFAFGLLFVTAIVLLAGLFRVELLVDFAAAGFFIVALAQGGSCVCSTASCNFNILSLNDTGGLEPAPVGPLEGTDC